MKTRLYILMILMPVAGLAQDFDTADYKITVDTSSALDHFFSRDPLWRGADGAASVDMGHGFDATYNPNPAKTSLYTERYNRYKELGNFIEQQNT